MKTFSMKKILLCLAFLVFVSSFIGTDTYRKINNSSFEAGEELQFRVHYGFINAGEATIDIGKTLYKVNDRVCYRVNVFGRSVGAFDMVLRIRNTYRSYIDTTAIIPHRFYVNIQEGKYRKEENVYFDHHKHKVKSEEKDESKEFDVPKNVQDIISGYYFLRTVDFSRLRVGDTVKVNAFFDDEVYDFKVKYRGKGEVETKFGKIKAIKITPVMPANKLFDGDGSIRVWLSDDANKIPVKVEADMFVGKVELDLKKYKGLKAEPKWYK